MRNRVVLALLLSTFAGTPFALWVIPDLIQVQKRSRSIAVYEVTSVREIRLRDEQTSNAASVVYQYELKTDRVVSGTPEESVCTYEKLASKQRFLMLLKAGTATELVISDSLQTDVSDTALQQLQSLDCVALPAAGPPSSLLRLVKFADADFVLAAGVIVPGCPLSMFTEEQTFERGMAIAQDIKEFHYAVSYAFVAAVLKHGAGNAECEAAFVYVPDDA